MKTIGTLLCLTLCTSVYAQDEQAPLAFSPSLEYTYDTCDGTDATGHGNTATFNGHATCPKGKDGTSALYFDGATVYTTTPGSSWNIAGTAVTYSGWLKIFWPGGTVFEKWADNSEDQRMYINSQGNFGVGLSPCFGWGVQYSTGTLPLKKWTFVSATFDGLNLRLYLDGKLDSTFTGPACEAASSGATFTMGKGGNGMLRATLDDFRLYQDVLSGPDILRIYKATRR